MKEVTINIRVEETERDEIDEIAERSKVSRSVVVRALVRDALERFRKSRRKRIVL